MAKERVWDDATALDQIAAALGLYKTDPGNNPGVLSDIIGYVQNSPPSTSFAGEARSPNPPSPPPLDSVRPMIPPETGLTIVVVRRLQLGS